MKPLELEGCRTQGTRESWATISACGQYRYALGRAWDPAPTGEVFDWQRPIFSIVMLNPSTADGTIDDPTIRKCIHFAKQEGCGALVVRNLFAWRATDPKELRRADDPVGPLNLDVLDLNVLFGLRVAAWGQLSEAWLRKRAQRPLSTATMHCSHVLALTDRGYDRSSILSRQPRHPLYLANVTRVVRWAEARRSARTPAETGPR